MTTDVVALDTDAAPLVRGGGGDGSGRSPAKSKLTCACAFRAVATRRDPDASPLAPLHPHTVGQLIRVVRATRRADTYPPLSLAPPPPLECYVCGLPSV